MIKKLNPKKRYSTPDITRIPNSISRMQVLYYIRNWDVREIELTV